MDSELLKGTLSLLILSLLSRRSMYGYEIAATVHRDTDGAFVWREGSLYPNLHKLQVDELIAGQWKENTMKAKCLSPTWAHLALALVIATGALFIVAPTIGIIPRIRMMAGFGWLELWNPNAANRPPLEPWFGSIIDFMVAAYNYWPRWVIPLAIVWLLFEWRARSENKALIRLAAMGTAALA